MGGAARRPLAAQTPESLHGALARAGLPGYRAGQVLDWYYNKGARTFAEMKNVGVPVRRFLEETFIPMTSTPRAVHEAGDGARKLEIALWDGRMIEAVVIEAQPRVTLCVSSQVGCPLGCAFCATGLGGFERDLAAHEIVEEALHAATVIGRGARVTHVVYMGMGEPCLNLDSVLASVVTLNSPWAFGIGARRMTISTLGFPKCIDRIAGFPLEVGLAISLHSADEEARKRLIPRAPASVKETIEAGTRYFKATGREVTYEYVLLAGVNDRAADARALAGALVGRRAFVNLIPYNEVECLEFKRPSGNRIAAFRKALEARGINVSVRDSRGRGAKAACGQLRVEKLAEGMK